MDDLVTNHQSSEAAETKLSLADRAFLLILGVGAGLLVTLAIAIPIVVISQ